jgi:lipopolysaccharide transport system ATP-binding protein
MSETAIKVHGLSKRYRIQRTDQPYYFTLRDTLTQAATGTVRALTSAVRRTGQQRPKLNQYIWSLNDVSFDVKVGEVVGVIGRNGAGKSTLLKILSRVTEPTRGWADIRGHIGSLLEVGTGFHEELSGRENVYLSGAILGMKKSDIDRKFNSIVDFAEVDRFIDTPVKHYSSGMYMRLAFSVAAHLQPDVLLVDEVLAVGDVAFQQKCLEKMENIAAGGRTVLFVSHNLAAIKQFCQTAIVLNEGMLDFCGPTLDGVGHYLRFASPEADHATGDRGTRWTNLRLNGRPALEIVSAASGEPFRVEGLLDCPHGFARGRLICHVLNASREVVICDSIDHRKLGIRAFDAGRYLVGLEFPTLWLTPGVYTVSFTFKGEVNSKQRNFDSGSVMINITGRPSSNGRATLAPPLRWALEVDSKVVATAGPD